MEERRTFSQFPTATLYSSIFLAVENNLFTRLPPSTPPFCIGNWNDSLLLPKMHTDFGRYCAVACIVNAWSMNGSSQERPFCLLFCARVWIFTTPFVARIVLTATTWSCKSNAFFVYITARRRQLSFCTTKTNSMAFACHTNHGGYSLTTFTSHSKAWLAHTRRWPNCTICDDEEFVSCNWRGSNLVLLFFCYYSKLIELGSAGADWNLIN